MLSLTENDRVAPMSFRINSGLLTETPASFRYLICCKQIRAHVYLTITELVQEQFSLNKMQWLKMNPRPAVSLKVIQTEIILKNSQCGYHAWGNTCNTRYIRWRVHKDKQHTQITSTAKNTKPKVSSGGNLCPCLKQSSGMTRGNESLVIYQCKTNSEGTILSLANNPTNKEQYRGRKWHHCIAFRKFSLYYCKNVLCIKSLLPMKCI